MSAFNTLLYDCCDGRTECQPLPGIQGVTVWVVPRRSTSVTEVARSSAHGFLIEGAEEIASPLPLRIVDYF